MTTSSGSSGQLGISGHLAAFFKQNQITEIISESPEIVVDTTNDEIINPEIVEEANEQTNSSS